MEDRSSGKSRSLPDKLKSLLWCDPVRATCRRSLYLMTFLAMLVVLLVVAARVWFPGADQYKTELESYLCELTGQRVTIGELETRFHGLTPGFSARNVLLHEKDQQYPSLALASVDADLDLLALLRGKPRVKRLVIASPSLIVERLENGHFVVAGVGVGARKKSSDLSGTLAKLLDQKQVELLNAHVVWRDRKYPQAPELVLEDADIKFVREGKLHTLSLKADIGDLTPHLEIKAAISGDPMAGPEAWDGNINAKIDALNLGALPPILAEAIHVRLQGRMDVNAQSQWGKGGVVSGQADVSGADVNIGVKKMVGDIRLADFSNRFQWGGRVAEGDWELVSRGFNLALKQPDLRLRDDLRLIRQDGRVQLSLGGIDVNNISKFVSSLGDSKVVREIAALDPRGKLRTVVLDLPEGPGKPALFKFSARVKNFRNQPYHKIPGLRGISGDLTLSQHAGQFALKSGKSVLNYAHYFTRPIKLAAASADARWRKDGDVWLISVKDAQVKNADLEGGGSVDVAYPTDHTLSPQLKLDINFRNGRGEHAAGYYPDKIMSPKLVKWLTSSIKGGHVDHGSLKFDGPVKAFPFYHDEGVFIIHADISDATLDYFPGWPRVEKSDVSLRFNGAAMTITGAGGTLAGQTIEYVNVHIADLKAKDNHLKIVGDLSGPAGPAVDFLTNGPLRGKDAKPLHGWSATGEGDTHISLDLPLSRPSDVKVNGKYLAKNVSLRIPGDVDITDLNNSIEFTENLVQCKSLVGNMLGGKVDISITTPKPEHFAEVLVKGRGSADPPHLANFLGEAVTHALSGRANWDGAVRVTRKGVTIDVSSDLKGMAIKAPEPLSKPARASWPLLLKSRFVSNQADRTTFSLKSHLYGNMLFAGEGEKYGLSAAKIVVGSSHGGWANDGIVEVALDAEKFDADVWTDFFSTEERRVSAQSEAAAQEKKPGFVDKLNRVAGKVGRLHALSRDFGAVEFELDRHRGKQPRWTGMVKGDAAAGNVEFVWSDRKKRVEASLTHLRWPRSDAAGSDATASDSRNPWNPGKLPEIKLAALDTRYGKIDLGQMHLRMKPGKTRWEIHTLDLTRPDMTLKVSDQAVVTGPPKKTPLGAGKVVSQFNVNLHSSDVAATLAALDYPDQMTGKSGDVTGTVFWKGGPEDFSWGNLNADLNVDVRDGRILKVNPGLGRMLGALNLESLLRRLKLDFTDVFDKGFAFDKIAGDIRVRDGEGFTDELVISGPGANIIISGRTALVDRQYNLRVTAIPPLGGNASLVGFALGGPAAGVLIWLGDKLLKHPLGKLIHYEYKVTGSWDDPVVESLGAVEKGSVPGLPDTIGE